MKDREFIIAQRLEWIWTWTALRSEETFLPVGITPGTEINDEHFFYCSADSIKHSLAAISEIPNTFPVLEIYIFFFFVGKMRGGRKQTQ